MSEMKCPKCNRRRWKILLEDPNEQVVWFCCANPKCDFEFQSDFPYENGKMGVVEPNYRPKGEDVGEEGRTTTVKEPKRELDKYPDDMFVFYNDYQYTKVPPVKEAVIKKDSVAYTGFYKEIVLLK